VFVVAGAPASAVALVAPSAHLVALPSPVSKPTPPSILRPSFRLVVRRGSIVETAICLAPDKQFDRRRETSTAGPPPVFSSSSPYAPSAILSIKRCRLPRPGPHTRALVSFHSIALPGLARPPLNPARPT